MVHLMLGMGIEEFSRKPSFGNVLGVELKLPQRFNSHTDDHHSGMKTDHRQPHVEKRFVQQGEPAVPYTGAQVEMMGEW